MRAILEGQVDPVQAGIFLIALRMKRETDDECKGVMEAILDATQMVTAPADEVFHVVDPYDGFNRTLPSAPFLATLRTLIVKRPAITTVEVITGPVRAGLFSRTVSVAPGTL